MKLLAAAGLLTPFASTPVTASDERNEMDYSVDHHSDEFDEKTITNSGAIDYVEQRDLENPATSPSTWQAGSWVNASDDSSDSNTWTGDVWFSGCDNSRVTIEQTGSAPSELVLETVHLYKGDEDDDDFPSEYAEWAFDAVWAIATDSAPFPIPSPTGLMGVEDEDDKKTKIDRTTVDISFDDPTPAIDDESSTTQSVDWKWDVMGTPESGWHHVGANREVERGYYYLSSGQTTFENESEHQLRMISAFCYYRSDSSDCEFDEPPGGITPEESQCCEVDALDLAIDITDSHIEHAQSQAAEISTVESSEFGEQAKANVDIAEKLDDPFRRLVAYRSAAALAAGSIAQQRARADELDRERLPQHTESLKDKIDSHQSRLAYTGESLPEALAKASEIERSLISSQTWSNQVPKILENNNLDNETRAMYAESGLEFARGNLHDAKIFQEAVDSADHNGSDYESNIRDQYERFSKAISTRLSGVSHDGDHASYVLENAEVYFERARERYEQEYIGLALLDLLYARTYIDASSLVASDDLNAKDRDTLTVEQELTTDEFNQMASSAESLIALPILNVAKMELGEGNQCLRDFDIYGTDHYRKRSYVHYRTAQALMELAQDAHELLSGN
ncbi:hypothetical protein [Natronobacterium haloterrestre]|nr:hypothetical protein [Halobiforma haloterrestris]